MGERKILSGPLGGDVPGYGAGGGGRANIRLGTYNIRNSRNRGLESALRGISQANMDVGVF